MNKCLFWVISETAVLDIQVLSGIIIEANIDFLLLSPTDIFVAPGHPDLPADHHLLSCAGDLTSHLENKALTGPSVRNMNLN